MMAYSFNYALVAYEKYAIAEEHYSNQNSLRNLINNECTLNCQYFRVKEMK